MLKKNNQTKLKILLVLFFCYFSGSALGASASELPTGVVIGDDSGIQVKSDGKYFIQHNDIKPGITFKKKITISNYGKDSTPFDLRLTMKEDQVEGDINLLEAIKVTLTFEEKIIYKGDLIGNAEDEEIKLPLYLGKFESGDTKVLEAVFEVSNDYPKEKWKKKNEADFFWGFYGTKESEKKINKQGLLPQTGEEWSKVIMSALIGAIIIIMILSEIKKKQNKSN